MPKSDLDWLSGVLDSRAHFGLSKNHSKSSVYSRGFTWQPRLCITSMNKGFLQKIRSIIGSGRLYGPYRRHNRSYFKYELSGNDLREFLPKLKLRIKEKQSRLLIRALFLLTENRKGKAWLNDRELEEISTKLRETV